jgi:hypothetical protein
MRLLLPFATTIALVLACGGSGSSSSGTAPPTDPPTQGDTFAIRASVSNVRGAGLALRNNGVDTLEFTPGTATAAFSTRLSSGARFAVRVARQPTRPSQTCTLTNPAAATGLVGSADVSVDVACVTDRFAIGGTVQGLTGDGLVVGMAGQPNVAVSSGATQFTFPGLAESGSSYDVSIVSQPNAQQCLILHGAGTVAGSDVTDVEIACDPVALTDLDIPPVEVTAGGSVTFTAVLIPGNATDPSLQWRVCGARPNDAFDCAPAAAATHGTIVPSSGEYTAPPTIATSPFRVHVIACQGAICVPSYVDVHTGAFIDSFVVTPQTINWDDHTGHVAVSWSVRDAARVHLSYPGSIVDVTGLASMQVPWGTSGEFTLAATHPSSPVPATRKVTVWVNPVTRVPAEIAAQGYLSPDGGTLICDVDVAYENTGGELASFTGFRISSDGGGTFGAFTPLPWVMQPFETTRWVWTYFGAPGQSFTQVVEEQYTVPSNTTVFTFRRTVTCTP